MSLGGSEAAVALAEVTPNCVFQSHHQEEKDDVEFDDMNILATHQFMFTPFPSPSSLNSLTPSSQWVSAGHPSHPDDAFLSETKDSFTDELLLVLYEYLFCAPEPSDGKQKLAPQVKDP